MKIIDLKPKTGNVELIATVTHVDEPREFDKAGSKGRVAKATIKDETGTCKLTLWNEQIDDIRQGEKVKITSGWADEYKGEMQVSAGKFGRIEILERDETIIEAIQHKRVSDEKQSVMKKANKEMEEENLYSDNDEIVFDADDEDII